MIKEYMQLLLSHKIRGITTIDDKHKLCTMQRNEIARKKNNW